MIVWATLAMMMKCLLQDSLIFFGALKYRGCSFNISDRFCEIEILIQI
jgi:hypothetical protein